MTSSNNIPPPKVVLLHDWLTGFRGGERVLEALCEVFPEAPIYTLLHKKGSTSPIIESREIVTSFLDKFPDIYNSYRKFLPLMPMAAERLKIHHPVDIVISSSHCVIKGVKCPAGAKHISYVHSPMRYMYDQFDSYFSQSGLIVKLVAHLIRPYLQFWDRQSNNNVTRLVANSNFVAQRMEHFYGKRPFVIHPFVDLDDFRTIQKTPPPKDNFFLMVTAFAPNKRLDLAIKSFKLLGANYQLKIIGTGSMEDTARLKSLAGGNVHFLGNCERSEVIHLMASAKAFIFPGIEDFGITPLESLASGTPVIAFKAGGVLETLTEKTALFFNEPNELALTKAIEAFNENDFLRENLISRAEDFSKEKFKQRILKEIENL